MLGPGTLCEELDILDLKAAERCKRELTVHLLDAPELIENRAEVDADSLVGLWPIFSHGDGHTFYYWPSRRRFLAHYHDPDILEDTGGSLAQAINVALDANFHFVPEDFSPVYWKPPSEFRMQFGRCGRKLTPEQFLAASGSVPKASHVYSGGRRADMIWAEEYSHLHFTCNNNEGSDVGPTADARFYCFQESQKNRDLAESLRLMAQSLGLEIYERAA